MVYYYYLDIISDPSDLVSCGNVHQRSSEGTIRNQIAEPTWRSDPQKSVVTILQWGGPIQRSKWQGHPHTSWPQCLQEGLLSLHALQFRTAYS